MGASQIEYNVGDAGRGDTVRMIAERHGSILAADMDTSRLTVLLGEEDHHLLPLHQFILHQLPRHRVHVPELTHQDTLI